MNLPDEIPAVELSEADGLANKWILHRLEEVKKSIAKATEEYRFNEIAQILYKFIWSEFCDWYLEMIKPALYGEDETAKAATQKVLWTVLSEIMGPAPPCDTVHHPGDLVRVAPVRQTTIGPTTLPPFRSRNCVPSAWTKTRSRKWNCSWVWYPVPAIFVRNCLSNRPKN